MRGSGTDRLSHGMCSRRQAQRMPRIRLAPFRAPARSWVAVAELGVVRQRIQDTQLATMNSSNHDFKEQEGKSLVSPEYRKDKSSKGKINIVMGILLLISAGFDVASGLFDSWYSHLPFVLTGCAFLIYGIIQLRSQKPS